MSAAAVPTSHGEPSATVEGDSAEGTAPVNGEGQHEHREEEEPPADAPHLDDQDDDKNVD